MTFDWLNILSIMTISQSFFMSVAFFNYKKKNNITNRLFAILLFVFAWLVTSDFFCSAGVYTHFLAYHKLIFMVSKSAFLIGPLIYFYVSALLDPSFVFQKKHAIHLIPFLLVESYSIFYLSSLHQFIIWYSPLEIITCKAVLVQNLIYIVLLARQIRSHNISFSTFFSQNHSEKLTWLRFVFCAFVFLWIIQLQSFVLLQLLKIIQWCGYTASLYFIGTFIFVYAIAYLTWRNPWVFLNDIKYRKSGFNEESKNHYREKLVSLMTSKTVYRDPMLSSQKLAKEMGIPVPYLSQLINESFQSNFYDFVNKHRIEDSKQLLSDPANQQKTILEIAYQVGFNSKATFNSAFKKFTGLTPSQFRSH